MSKTMEQEIKKLMEDAREKNFPILVLYINRETGTLNQLSFEWPLKMVNDICGNTLAELGALLSEDGTTIS